jgi:hypothetical protein
MMGDLLRGKVAIVTGSATGINGGMLRHAGSL